MQTLAPGDWMPRHRHAGAYAALVVRGGYVEAGDSGRFHVGPGQVVVHAPFEGHQDRLDRAGAIVLNLPLHACAEPGHFSLADPDAIIRLAERDTTAAVEQLGASITESGQPSLDWPDRLARALALDDAFEIRDWADALGIAPQSVSRGFRSAYGISPKAYRAEHRAVRAIRALRTTAEPIVAVAAELGFADQAHMSRAVRAVSGLTPMQIRVQSVQAGAVVAL